MNQLLYKYFEGKTSPCEEERIVEWVEQSDEHRRQFRQMRMLYDASLFVDIVQKPSRKPSKYFLYPLLAVAAMLALVLIIRWPAGRSEAPLLTQSIHIPAGQRAQMVLPDGTNVWINSSTTLSYDADFGRGSRRVNLDGEAYFEVAHNREIPFYVQTDQVKIEVTGTKFDVCAYRGIHSFVARLIEGSINLRDSRCNERMLGSLTQGKYFLLKNGKQQIGELTDRNALAWIQGIYYFDDVPFKELLERIALYYNYTITVENPKLLDGYRCTGKFKDLDGIEHILRVIKKDHPFSYEIDNENNRIILR